MHFYFMWDKKALVWTKELRVGGESTCMDQGWKDNTPLGVYSSHSTWNSIEFARNPLTKLRYKSTKTK